MLEIYTDGSTLNNGSDKASGSFAVIVVENGKIINAFRKQCDTVTTNNREEMKAILWAMSEYGNCKVPPIVYSDSSYSVNTFTNWKNSWKANGWIKADKKIPENLDLVQLYDKMEEIGYKIELKHIKGHAGNKYNELVDKYATGKINIREVYNVR